VVLASIMRAGALVGVLDPKIKNSKTSRGTILVDKTSVVTPALVEVKTLGSSGAYTAPEDPQVSAHSEPWTQWYSRSTKARVSTRRTRAV
jgi:hypothetical protein